MRAFIDLKNKTFGRLTALYVESNVDGVISWMCECNCELKNRVIVLGSSLRSGHTKSCGCLFKEHASQFSKTHGMRNTPIYTSWQSMKDRCNNVNNKDYYLYGGRGIIYNIKWNSFEEFYKDMGETWFLGGTIDRINTNGNYEPNNCRWATMKEQNLNKNSNIICIINGENLALSEVSIKYNIIYTTLIARYKSGLRNEELISPILNKAELQSNIIGVTWDKNSNKWSSRLEKDYKMIYLGTFKDMDDAIKARLQAEIVNLCKENAPQKHLFEFYTVEDCLNFKKKEKYNGVVWHKRQNIWVARITYNKVNTYLGSFDNFENVIVARLLGEIEIYGKDLAPQRHLFEQYGI